MPVPPDFPCTNECPYYASQECQGHMLEVCKTLGTLMEIYLSYEEE